MTPCVVWYEVVGVEVLLGIWYQEGEKVYHKSTGAKVLEIMGIPDAGREVWRTCLLQKLLTWKPNHHDTLVQLNLHTQFLLGWFRYHIQR